MYGDVDYLEGGAASASSSAAAAGSLPPLLDMEAHTSATEDAPAATSGSLAVVAAAPDAAVEDDDPEDDWIFGDTTLHPKVRRFLDHEDPILHKFNCARVVAMDTRDGIILLCSKNLYVIDDLFVTPDGEIVDAPDNSSASAAGKWAVSSAAAVRAPGESLRWPVTEIREIHRRRYLLQEVALEVFLTTGLNYLLVFSSKSEMTRVHDRIMGISVPSNLLKDVINPIGQLVGFVADSVVGQLAISAAGGGGGGGLGAREGGEDQRIGGKYKVSQKVLTQRWQNGEISNFLYLMHLNTLAGRSYNDLTQYPVFPWVLSDYTSEELDLTNPAVYRDLSKPMGALSAKRAAEFAARYESWEDPDGVVPPFHYGTHYSSAGIVLHYLIRLEPFTRYSIALQSGKFDYADRLFHSIHETWRLASETSGMADVKELLPEFYYMSEFLDNPNNFDLGTKQGGVAVDKVILPPWARGDPREFTRKMRAALESDYVSEHLHEWIDLIFGYKQTGEAAVKALNVFYYLTYEGQVDLDAIDDPMRKASIVAQINNFGQSPHQLFKDPHPARIARPASTLTPTVCTEPEALNLIEVTVRETGWACELLTPDKSSPDKIFAHRAKTLAIPPRLKKYFSWGYPDCSLRIFSSDHKPLRVFEGLHDGPLTVARMTDDARLIVTAGSDTVVSVWDIDHSPRTQDRRLNLRASLCGHRDAVLCLAINDPWSIILSGSRDATVIVWDLNRLTFIRQLTGCFAGPVTAVDVSSVTGHIVAISGCDVHLFDLNGRPMGTARGSVQISCAAIVGIPEWKEEECIITGHRDSSLKIWSRKVIRDKAEIESFDQALRAQQPQETAEGRRRFLRDSPATPQWPYRDEIALRASYSRSARPVITTLMVAQDAKRFYAADESGSISAWAVPDQLQELSDIAAKAPSLAGRNRMIRVHTKKGSTNE